MRILEGIRYCSIYGGIVEWEEGEEAGCHWCGPDTFFDQNHSEVAVLE